MRLKIDDNDIYFWKVFRYLYLVVVATILIASLTIPAIKISGQQRDSAAVPSSEQGRTPSMTYICKHQSKERTTYYYCTGPEMIQSYFKEAGLYLLIFSAGALIVPPISIALHVGIALIALILTRINRTTN